MGGVVDAISDAVSSVTDKVTNIVNDVVDTTKELVKDTYDTIEDGAKKTVDILVENFDLAIETILAPTQITYDTIIKGESFSGSVSKQIQEIGRDMGDVYNGLLDDTLGIDDGKFLGIKGGVFSKLGMITKDLYHDHATETFAIGVIVAMIVISILFPPAYEFAGTIALAAFEAGVVSSLALTTIYYATLTAVSLGVSAIISGVIDGAILAMYPSLIDNMLFFSKQEEILRMVSLSAIMNGTIFDRLAGGWMYDSQFAGSVYYDASTCANLDISVGGQLSLTPHAVRTQFGYVDSTLKDLAGSDNFSVLTNRA